MFYIALHVRWHQLNYEIVRRTSMAYKSINVEITQEHFERSIKGSPREAIKELIWNACDADAQNIEVSFD